MSTPKHCCTIRAQANKNNLSITIEYLNKQLLHYREYRWSNTLYIVKSPPKTLHVIVSDIGVRKNSIRGGCQKLEQQKQKIK